MKKILIVLAVIFLVIIGAIVVFALTFDANRYKGVIIEKASQAMQKDVTLGRISLDFSHGLGCRIDGLALKEKNTEWDNAWLKARSAEINLRILPLLRKDIQVGRIEIEGLDLKLSDELLKQPVQPVGSSQGTPDAGIAALGALKFFARAVVVKDSIVTYTPAKSKNSVKLGISTLMLNNVSLSGPVRVSAILSTLDKGRDNIVVKGIVFPELSSKGPYIKTLELKLDVASVDLPALLRAFGYTQDAERLIDKKMRGIVTISADKLFIDRDKIFNSNVSLRLSDFETDILPLKGGVKNLILEAELSGKDLVIKNCSGSVAGGTFSARGSIKDIFSSQLSSFDISCSSVNLDSLAPKAGPGSPRFQGTGDLKASVTGRGLQQGQLMQSLAGSGSLKIDKPVLKNMNILRTAFEKMDMLPGLVARLRENLPENYTEVLKQNDTNFKPMNINYTISQGKLLFKEADVESDGFLVKGGGEIGLLGDVQISSYVFIAPDLSQAFVKVVKELRFLANEQGMINMPLAISGKAPQVSVGIDRDYVLRKLIVSKGSELLEGIFKKKDTSQDQPQPQPGQSQQDMQNSNAQQKKDGPNDTETLIKSIFDAIGSQK